MERISSLEEFQEDKWVNSGAKQIAFGDPNNEWLTDDCFFTYTGFQGEQYQPRRGFFTSVIQLTVTGKCLTGRIIEPLAKGCEKLEILDLSESSIDVVGKISEGEEKYEAAKFPELTRFRMNKAAKLEKILLDAPKLTRLEAENCPQLSELSVYAPNLETVLLRNAKEMDNSSLKKLIDQSSELKTLRTLKLKGCEKIKERDILEVAPYYPVDYLTENINERFKVKVKELLKKESKDDGVFLDKITLKPKEVEALRAALLIRCDFVKTLSFAFSFLGREVTKLIDVFPKCISLQSLNLECNEIEGYQIEKLTEALPNSLLELTLTRNKIGKIGVKKLAKIVQNCPALQTLRLGLNAIGDDGATALAEILPKCTTLQILNLEFNEIGNHGAKALANVLPDCTSLQFLYLGNNDIGSEGAQLLLNFLSNCKLPFFEKLYLGGNPLMGSRVVEEWQKESPKKELLSLELDDEGLSWLKTSSQQSTEEKSKEEESKRKQFEFDGHSLGYDRDGSYRSRS